jgi:UDP-GlcNAc:undecaprenyl-phosphate GlcNAc-1-phosphate transferase
VSKFALYFNIVDKPDTSRHWHEKGIPLLGGVAIFLSFWIISFAIYSFTNFLKEDINGKQLLFLFLGSLVIMILGFFDDLYKIKALNRLLISAVAVFLVMLGGINFDGITNPLGGTIGLDFWQISLGGWGNILVIADLLIFFWLIGMMYTTKVLDGLDGLSTGIVLIGALLIASIASTSKFYQPDIKILCLVFAGSLLGFLWFNFYPAKIFLGEGGSMLLGLILGFLAIVSGGKIATALLVMAVPVLDLARVIYRRHYLHHSILEGDREHLHFKLLDLGLTHRQSVLFLYAMAFLFGITTLIFTSVYKLIILMILFLAMIIFEILISKKYSSS